MDLCSEKCIHLEQVKKTAKTMPDADVISGMAEIFKALSDPSRLRIVTALMDREHCVCDIAAICNQSESAISHQLRLLRNLRVVRNRREGKIVYYALDDEHVRSLLQMSLDHITHKPI
ncbi:MAG: metalloregulator ArsR/SmtB family transcription factor [Desulfobacter sp.]